MTTRVPFPAPEDFANPEDEWVGDGDFQWWSDHYRMLAEDYIWDTYGVRFDQWGDIVEAPVGPEWTTQEEEQLRETGRIPRENLEHIPEERAYELEQAAISRARRGAGGGAAAAAAAADSRLRTQFERGIENVSLLGLVNHPGEEEYNNENEDDGGNDGGGDDDDDEREGRYIFTVDRYVDFPTDHDASTRDEPRPSGIGEGDDDDEENENEGEDGNGDDRSHPSRHRPRHRHHNAHDEPSSAGGDLHELALVNAFLSFVAPPVSNPLLGPVSGQTRGGLLPASKPPAAATKNNTSNNNNNSSSSRSRDKLRHRKHFADTFRTPCRNPDQILHSDVLSAQILRRELGTSNPQHERARTRRMLQTLIPGGKADAIIHFSSRAFSGQFSPDGSLFYTANQDMRVRLYDTSNPYDWRFHGCSRPVPGQWTLTDAHMSHDNEWIAYSTISTTAYLTRTGRGLNTSPISLDITTGTVTRPFERAFSIWSLRFSPDDRELLTGMGQSYVCTYDLETRQTKDAIPAHSDEVNGVDYGGPNQPHLVYTASDDTTIKIWDRRTLATGAPVGVFIGHTEGVTFVEAHENGRYLVSNGKDQRAKVWDLRHYHDPAMIESSIPNLYSTGFDYRIPSHKPRWSRRHPRDCSVQTLTGHEVLGTLIRCHFSPAGSSDGAFVYSGSYDGKVHVWDAAGDVVGLIDTRDATLKAHRADQAGRGTGSGLWDVPDGPEGEWNVGGERGNWLIDRTTWKTVVRDVSWHPSAPVLVASAWNGRHGAVGTCSIFSWDPNSHSQFQPDSQPEQQGPPPRGQSRRARRSRRRDWRDVGRGQSPLPDSMALNEAIRAALLNTMREPRFRTDSSSSAIAKGNESETSSEDGLETDPEMEAAAAAAAAAAALIPEAGAEAHTATVREERDWDAEWEEDIRTWGLETEKGKLRRRKKTVLLDEYAQLPTGSL